MRETWGDQHGKEIFLYEIRLLENPIELKLRRHVWELVFEIVFLHKKFTWALQTLAIGPKMLSWQLQFPGDNVAKTICSQQESNATYNWLWQRSCRMAPPACLDQIWGPVSQSGVAARCFDNKHNSNIKMKCYLPSIPVGKRFCSYLRRVKAWKRIRVCCVYHLRWPLLQDSTSASLLGLLAKIKV